MNVHRKDTKYAEKHIAEILKLINRYENQSGIIYCFKRIRCEELSAALNACGIKCYYFHAGMSSLARKTVQENWMKEEF